MRPRLLLRQPIQHAHSVFDLQHLIQRRSRRQSSHHQHYPTHPVEFFPKRNVDLSSLVAGFGRRHRRCRHAEQPASATWLAILPHRVSTTLVLEHTSVRARADGQLAVIAVPTLPTVSTWPLNAHQSAAASTAREIAR